MNTEENFEFAKFRNRLKTIYLAKIFPERWAIPTLAATIILEQELNGS
jgi:hypothetical protein